MFGLSGIELFLIIIFAFLIIGPEKLPQMAKTLGKGIAKFRQTQQEMSDIVKTDIYDPNAEQPFKDPSAALKKIDSSARKAKKDAEELIEETRAAAKQSPSKQSTSAKQAKVQAKDAEEKQPDESAAAVSDEADGAVQDAKAAEEQQVSVSNEAEAAGETVDGGMEDADSGEEQLSFSQRKAQYLKERDKQIERGEK